MANDKQVPVNPAEVIEAAEARVTADADTEREKAEKKRADLESKLKSGDALTEALAAHMKDPTPQIPTGFNVLDRALGDGLDDGGLPPGLITLGAIPSLGKTALVLEMADNIAKSGRDVLFVALEMSALELTARSISRLTAESLDDDELESGKPRALTARGVRLYHPRREKFKPQNQAEAEYWQEMDERLEASITHYRERIAPRIHIHEPDKPIAASQIRGLVDLYADVLGTAPVVILDYIQILSPEPGDERKTEKANMDAAALTLKHLSRDYKIPVFCISSFNRMNYGEQVSMESFKESGGIEYSSDAVIGLQLYGTGMYYKKGQTLDVEFEKSRNPRRVQARILKNRDGETGRFINLEYFPAVNLFREISTKPERDAKKDIPAHWKSDPPRMKQTTLTADGDESEAVDLTGILEAPKKKKTAHPVISEGT